MKCRIDGSSCDIFLDFGKMPIANGVCNKKNFRNEYFFKLKAAFNKKLSLFQIVDYPSPKKMF
nr:SAM-dependent methyltransferase [Pelagibacterales bacterium]